VQIIQIDKRAIEDQDKKLRLAIPGGLLGLKIPDLAVDSNKVNLKMERKRMVAEEKYNSIEFKLKEYQNNASVYTTSHPKVVSQPETNFRKYIDNQVDMMSRLSCDKLKYRILAHNAE
jgi:hypothetical protein